MTEERAYPHVHSKSCSSDVCGVGPSRAELVRATLLRRLERGEEFLHYKKADVQAMKFAPSVFVSPPHSAPREGSSGSPAVDPGETSPVSTSAPRYPQAPSEAEPAPSLETAAPHAAPAARAHQPGGQP